MPPILADGEGHDIRDILAVDISHLIDSESAAGSWADALTYSQSITVSERTPLRLDAGEALQGRTASRQQSVSSFPHSTSSSPKG